MRCSSATGIFGALLTACACFAFQTPAKPSLPYKAIEHAEFIPASQATFMSDRDRLIGLTDGRIAKAYPAGILAQHGLVQDKLAASPIAVTW
jgi:Protein of unknown function (DUF3179)